MAQILFNMYKTKTLKALYYMSDLGYPWQKHQWFSKTCVPVIGRKQFSRQEVKVKGKRKTL